MTLETDSDLRAMFDENEFAELIYLGAGIEIFGIWEQRFESSFDINGEFTGFRCIREDVAGVAIGSTLKRVKTDISYTVRAKEQHRRSTVLVLEAQ